MGSNEVIPALPPGFVLDPALAEIPPPPAGFTLDATPNEEVPPLPPGFTLDGPSPELRGSVVGPNGSAVPEGTETSAAPTRPVTQGGFEDFRHRLKTGQVAKPTSPLAGQVVDAATSEDTPEQAAAKARIRSSAEAVDESSLWGDLKTSYQNFSEGQLGSELAGIDAQIERERITPGLLGEISPKVNVKELETRKIAAIQELIAKRKAPRSPDNPTYKALNMEENSDAATALKNTITALGTDPWGVFRSAAAQSGMASVPPIIGGIAGAAVAGVPGAAIGAGIGSFNSEYGADIIEGLEHFGADMSSEKSIAETLRTHGREIRNRSFKKAAVVAFVDSIGGSVSGRIAAMPVRGLGKRAAQVSAGTLVGATSGMVGEAGGQIAQDGGISDYNAVYQEALGEALPGAITEAGQIVGNKLLRGSAFGDMPSEDELKRLWDESNPNDPITTYREATNSGRTLYGFAEEGKPTKLSSYEDAEALMGQGDARRGRLIAVSPEQATTAPVLPESKIRDETGNLRVLYHGTKGDFETFRAGGEASSGEGIYFTSDPSLASVYAEGITSEAIKKAGANVRRVYLDIKNPFIIKEPSFWKRLRSKLAGTSRKDESELRRQSAYFTKEEVNALIAQGYDGVINPNASEVVAFFPEQVRNTFALNEEKFYNGPTKGLAITPREDNYLHGSYTSRTYNTGFENEFSVYNTKDNEKNAVDLDTFKEATDAEGLTIVPLNVARRVRLNADVTDVVDQTFNFTSPEARQMLLTSIDGNLISELFKTKQITWKGRLDPRFLTAGLHDVETDGFMVLDADGRSASDNLVLGLLQRAEVKFKNEVRRIPSSMRFLQGTYSSVNIRRELDTVMSKKPGVVAFGEHPDMPKLTKFVERIRELTGMKQQIIFVVARPSGYIRPDGTPAYGWEAPGFSEAMPFVARDASNYMANFDSANGFYNLLTPEVSFIGITDHADRNSSFVHQGEQLLEVIAHEMGHALVAEKLVSAPLSTVLKVYSAFRRMRTAFDEGGYIENTPNSTRGPWIGRIRSPFFGASAPYSYSATMEEWLAEQVARWALSDAKPLGTVTKLFRDLGKRIIATLKELRVKEKDFKPEVEMEEWLRSLYAKQTVTRYTDTVQQMVNIASTYQNQQVDHDPTPAHEDTADIYAVLDEFGPKRKPFSTASHQSAVRNAAVTKAVVDKYNWFYRWAANLRQLAEANPHIVELQIARELFAFAKMESSKIMVSADTTLQAWRKLGEKRGRQLSAFLFDLNEMNYLSDTERQAGVMRWPTQQEFVDLATQYQLDNESLAVYREVRDFFLETVKREEELKLMDAQKIVDPKLKLEAIATAKKTSTILVSKPYFPQSRFGKYSLTVRSKATNKLEHFELFETKREAKLAAYQATKMWPEADWDVVQSEIREDVQQFTGMSPWMLDKIRNMPGLTKDQLLWIDELRYQIAPSQSFTKHMMRRKKYTGFSTDGRRTFAAYAFHHARNYPRVKFAEAFRDAIKSLDMSLPADYSPLERAKRKPMADMLQHQVNEFMNPSQDWAQLRAMNAIFHLGFNPKSAVVNMTQVFFSAAFLGAKFGGTKAERSILAAGAKLNTFYRKGAYHKATDAEFRAIDRAMKDGHIDESMAAELAALAVGGGMGTRIGKSFVGDKFLHGYISFTEKAMWMFRMAEQWQRRVVFRAAWQLAVDNPSNEWVNSQAQKNPLLYDQLQKEGWTSREALAYLSGVDALQSTIGVYDRDSRARYAQGRKSVLFAFQSFTQQMLWTLWNNKDMWARYMLYYAVIGGSMGIVPDDFKGLLTLLGRMLFGNQFNLQRSTREFIVEMLGNESKIPPDLILHGTARYGFGVPMIMQTLGAKFVPDVDLSPSITLNRLIPLDLGKINLPGAKFHDVLATQVEAASGAAYGIPISMWKALAASDMDVMDFKRWEGAMPAAARNVSKAFRYGFGQGERDKNFATTVGFDGDDPEQLGEIIATALGFRPTRLAQKYDRQAAAREIDQFWSVRKEMLMRQAYRDKFVYKDTDAFKETQEQIEGYNKEVFDKKYLITSEGLRTSMRNRAKAVQKVETNQVETPNLKGQMDKMFPETVLQKKVR